MPTLRLVPATFAAVLLAACGDDGAATRSSAGGGGSSSSAGPTASSSEAAGSDSAASTALASGVASSGVGGGEPTSPCEDREGSVGAWTPVTSAGAPTKGSGLVWNGTEVVVVDTLAGGVYAYAPDSDAWRELPPLPVEVTGRSFAYLAWVQGELFVWGGGDVDGELLSSGVVVDVESGASRPVVTDGAAHLEGSYFARGGAAFVSAEPAAVTMVSAGTDGTDWQGTYLLDDEVWTDVVPAQADPFLYACEDFAFHPDGGSIACNAQGDVTLFGLSPFTYERLPRLPLTDFTSDYAFGWQGPRLVAYARRAGGGDGFLVAIEPGVTEEWTTLGTHPDRGEAAYGMLGESFVVWGGVEDGRRSDGVVVPPDGSPVPMSCEGAPVANTLLSVTIGDGLFVFDTQAQVGGVFRL